MMADITPRAFHASRRRPRRRRARGQRTAASIAHECATMQRLMPDNLFCGLASRRARFYQAHEQSTPRFLPRLDANDGHVKNNDTMPLTIISHDLQDGHDDGRSRPRRNTSIRIRSTYVTRNGPGMTAASPVIAVDAFEHRSRRADRFHARRFECQGRRRVDACHIPLLMKTWLASAW